MPARNQETGRRLFSTPIILIGLGAFVAFLVLNGHGDHLLSLAPLLILFACPLMHVFMHRGHAARGEDGRPGSPRERSLER